MVTVQRKNPDGIRKVMDAMRAAAQREIAVGFPAGKAQSYPDTGESVADVAARNVYGIGVPERDFMTLGRQMIDRDSEILTALAAVPPLLNKGNPRPVAALQEAIGAKAASILQEAIVTGDWEPNSPATIRAKGEGKRPLIDTGHMRESVTYAVRERRR